MADRRKEPRDRGSLLVEVSGLDAHGEVFHESALATNLTQSGALLTGVLAEPRCGDLIAVPCWPTGSFSRRMGNGLPNRRKGAGCDPQGWWPVLPMGGNSARRS